MANAKPILPRPPVAKRVYPIEQWEYKYVETAVIRDDAIILLNKLGQEGWEVFNIEGQLPRCFWFKRRCQWETPP